MIALSFASLGTAMPRTGGPIVYTRTAFGDFAGFLIAWTYWIGAWVGNAAIITAFMLYFTYFVPGAATPVFAFLNYFRCIVVFHYYKYSWCKRSRQG